MIAKKQSIQKDFDGWNIQKEKIHSEKSAAYAHPREVWWCAIGTNIGAEIDGKNENFERPVLVLRVYNTETLLVLPITSKEKTGIFHQKIKTGAKEVWVSLTQIRVISNRRLIRKVDVISSEEFAVVQKVLKNFL